LIRREHGNSGILRKWVCVCVYERERERGDDNELAFMENMRERESVRE